MPDQEVPINLFAKFMNTINYAIDGPITWVREKIVEPNQKVYPWYHQKFRRVPTIDECYTDDPVCYAEANLQYKRDRQVDEEIVSILRQRFEHCVIYEGPDHFKKCKPLLDIYEEAATNWFIKYGDLGAYHNVKSAYMKQKHRMIWERRHGPVGSGVRTEQVNE
ncbi:NADH dehydrogenase [ubiquinone] 1 beta subcomplex subunit 10 [Coccinella septempunctata]|uniref:NADH dehydrogenase [ubiquinone] 1 beta subcomplex subunit 10 n=1 Tax=Coccinella septempunctata TaxID=41139 RepID=UPI001D07CDC0|nr:NADH dehydrogenase [ubiquinone] 1 beta subcomplex subunit 10 [Coccinella septempunctata]